MGRSHALTAAAGWLGGCALLAATGCHPANSAVLTGAAVSAGWALVPDVDHPGSTVSRTLGPASRLLSWVVAGVARKARALSCRHCARRPARGGHRGLTHTAVGAALAGMVVAVVCLAWGRTVGIGVVGFSVWLVSHTALSAAVRAEIGDLLLPGRFRRMGRWAHRFAATVGALMAAAAATAVLVQGTPGGSWWWLGLAVAWGCFAHACGDAMTLTAVPLAWPLRIRGCRWTPLGSPRCLRFRTGSWVETVVVAVMCAGGVWAAYLLCAG